MSHRSGWLISGVVLTGLLLQAASSMATPIASENFESYPVAALAGGAGGTGWGTNLWTTPAGAANVIDTTSSPLTYSIVGGATLNGATRADKITNTVAVSGQVTCSRQLGATRTATFYVSFLAQYSGTGAFGDNDTFSFYLSNGATITANAFNFGPRAVPAGGLTTFMVRTNTGNPVVGGQIILPTGFYGAGTNFLCVAQLVWDGTSFSTMNAWINPAFGDSGTPQITQSIAAGSGLTTVTHGFFRMFSANAALNDAWTVDNLVFGDTWSDVVPSSGPINPPPSVTLTNPVNNASFLAPANILLEATAADSNGTVTNVAFYTGATKLADDATEPFSYNWTGVAAASYALTAVATDNQGAATTSAVINITVTNVLNPPPSVTLTNPVNSASFVAPANILLEATASDSNGTVTNVAFYAGATKLADDAAGPFLYSWTGVAAGNYALTAVATDNGGLASTSSVVTISVTNLPAASTLIAQDSFYTGGGTLNGRNGGSGWAGAWVTNGLGNQATCVDATGASLQFTPVGGATIDGSAEAVDITGTAGAPAAYRQLASAQNGTFYVAYLLRQVAGSWGGNNTFSLHLADSGTNTSTLNFGIRGGADFMVRNGTPAPGPTNAFGGAVAFDTTYYVVARLSKPPGSTRYDRIEMWRNPGLTSSNAPDTTLTLPANTGLASITHLFFRAAAMDVDDVMRVDELKVGANWLDVIAPWTGTPAVDSFTLMYPGTNGPVPGYDPITNNATINLFLTGTNLSLRANSSPPFDFGSVAFSLTGPTAQSQTDNSYPWSLFGDAGGSYTGANFSVGAHSLTSTPYPADAAAGTVGIPASINFTVVNTIVIFNQAPTVTLTNPVNAATFTAPTNLLLQATAADADGTVTNVAFYNGAIKLGEVSSAPYAYLWSNVPAGAHTLTARATDNEGAVTVSPPVIISVLSTNNDSVVSGELKKWHKVMITWTGPSTSETNANNPFRNYRLNVTFTHPVSGKTYRVPGYWAADGNAANTSAQSGDQWRVNFAPDETGIWNFVASFRSGTDVAISSSPTAGVASDFDGASGSFVIGATDKTGRDHRGKGRLQYVGKHHLRFAETGEYFLKQGADSPENLLDYEDFDDQPNINSGNSVRKAWVPHASDYSAADASAYTWAGGKGTNLLGAIKYLSDKGMNAFSFIPFTVDGDDKQVFPHRLVSTAADYVSAIQPRWTKNVIYHDRFDVSKMDQWDRIFEYGDKKGMYLHFKTLETENEVTMDGGNLGTERILYYRELIARYGYHLALNWNLGEEINSATSAQKIAWSQYFYDNDPYRHHQVIHNGANHYEMLGTASHLTGFSKQAGPGGIFVATLDYLTRSDAAGVPWVVAFDEQNSANDGIKPDADEPTHDSVRGDAIWAHLLAGGAGGEYYFGYAWAHNDLNCQDLRSRDTWWNQCRYALEFFKSNAIPFWNMTNRDALLTGAGGSHCFATNGQVYVGHLVTNATPSLNLAGVAGDFMVRWFNPFSGGALQTGTVAQVTGGSTSSLGSPPNNSTKDWVVLVKLVPPPDTTPPSVSITSPTNGASLFANLPVPISASVTDNVAVAKVELQVDSVLQIPTLTNAPFQFTVTNLTLGSHTLSAIGEDSAGNRATNSINVILIAPASPPLSLLASGGLIQLSWSEPGFALQQAAVISGPWASLAPASASPFTVMPTNAESYFRLKWTAP